MQRISAPAGEFELIARYFAPLAKGFPGAFGLLDDAAVIAALPGHELVAKTDAIVGGVHFLLGDPPDSIARKALRVNLSEKIPRSRFWTRPGSVSPLIVAGGRISELLHVISKARACAKPAAKHLSVGSSRTVLCGCAQIDHAL